jgi:hypothetical protein
MQNVKYNWGFDWRFESGRQAPHKLVVLISSNEADGPFDKPRNRLQT